MQKLENIISGISPDMSSPVTSPRAWIADIWSDEMNGLTWADIKCTLLVYTSVKGVKA